LFVKVSVVALPTNVSGPFGRDQMPEAVAESGVIVTVPLVLPARRKMPGAVPETPRVRVDVEIVKFGLPEIVVPVPA
jgi:hypothetical protein